MARKSKADAALAAMEAQWEAMQRDKTRRAKEDAADIARWQHIPEWLNVGTCIVSVISGQEYIVADIDKTRPDGLVLKIAGAPEYYRQDHTLGAIVTMVTRGHMIVYGYTPPELADGFRHSSIDWDDDKIIWIDKPPRRSEVDLEARYNKLKPQTLKK